MSQQDTAHAVQASRQAIELLRELVEALDATSWSSWQSTARFMPPLENARDWLAAIGQTS